MKWLKKTKDLEQKVYKLDYEASRMKETIGRIEMHENRLDTLIDAMNEKIDDNHMDVIKIKSELGAIIHNLEELEQSLKKYDEVLTDEEGEQKGLTQLQMMDEWLNGEEGKG